MDLIRRLARQTWLHIAVGMVLMGSWAFFANRTHPTPEAVQAAIVQGLLSGVLTGTLKAISDKLTPLVPHWTLAAGIALLVSATLLAIVHLVAGTPELAATIAVPLIVSGVYIFIYSFLSQRSRNA